ncbi:MAG: HugZ family protein [Acidobacteria bacterium]|nr:HugZ family protein [Acidobacteriota bacterium]
MKVLLIFREGPAVVEDPVSENARSGKHAGGARPSDATPAPEPSFAERSRTLLYLGRTGALSTVARRHPGWPFGSVMPYSLDERGRPIFLISTMAMHTQNMLEDPRASLLVAQPGWTGDPLAGGRVTLMGEVKALPPEELETTQKAYLARYENATYWVHFEDFGFHRMEVWDVYYVGGFGEMGWVSAEEYGAARPDPLADAGPGIVQHMNEDHADALVLMCRLFAGLEAAEATMTSVDRLGFRVRARTGSRVQGVRIAFPREVRNANEARAVFVAMVQEARGKRGGVPTV